MLDDAGAAARYEGLTRAQLVALLRTRDMQRKLGLVWERDAIDSDAAVDRNFVVADLIEDASARPAPWRNLVIEGDNYDSLRWLRMTHRGRIKCIYVDPPYNTGNKDWVYNDNYVDPAHSFRNSQWLEFLYRRFTLARDLLAPDGVLLCSINDTNRAVLELMMDKALPGMKVGSLTWRTRTGGNEGGNAFFSQNHEHLLIYGDSGFQFRGKTKTFSQYSNPDGDPRGDWTKSDLTQSKTYLQRPNALYPLVDPATGIHYPPNPDRVWVYPSREKSSTSRTRFIEDRLADKEIYFPDQQRVELWQTMDDLVAAIRTGDVPTSGRTPLLREDLPDLEHWVGRRVGFGTPRLKRFKRDLKNKTQPLSSWITPNSESDTVPDDANMIVSGTNDEGAKVIKSVFGSKAFNYPKPVSLIRELVRQSTGPGDIVLDFFAGSSTTAQAVMELNAEDGLDRRFIMASSTEATVDTPDTNICDTVTAERIRLLNTNDDRYEELSAGFAYLRCREIDPFELDEALTPAAAWTALEQHHGLPATLWQAGDTHAVHEQDTTALVLVDRWDEAGKATVQALLDRGLGLHIYAFSPGQLDGFASTDTVEVHGVVQTLRRLYRA